MRGRDLNPRPLGYEPNELPDCSTPRHLRNPDVSISVRIQQGVIRMSRRFAARDSRSPRVVCRPRPRSAAGRPHRRSDQARHEAERFPPHDQGRRQRLHLRGLPRRPRKVHDDQHVRRHQRRRAGRRRPGQPRRDQRAGRRDQESHAKADHDGGDRVRSRRSHRRQRFLPRRRALHHPPDLEGDPRPDRRSGRQVGPRQRMETAGRRRTGGRQEKASRWAASRCRSSFSAARTPAATWPSGCRARRSCSSARSS